MYRLNSNYNTLKNSDNKIIIYFDKKNTDNIFIIYNNINNILLILDTEFFLYFINAHLYNSLKQSDNVIISLYTRHIYKLKSDNSITDLQVLYIIIIVKLYMNVINANKDTILSENELRIKETDEFKSFNTQFTSFYINANNFKDEGEFNTSNRFTNKYMKYKYKYMKLKQNMLLL
jgi:hypothetical protein